jgi:hypothetical protein
MDDGPVVNALADDEQIICGFTLDFSTPVCLFDTGASVRIETGCWGRLLDQA